MSIELSTGAIEQGQGLLTLTDHLKNVTITELRYGDDRATVERKTTTSRKLTRPTLEQRRFDAAFQKD